MATYRLKLSIENCSQIAADGDMVTIHSLKEVARDLSDGTIADALSFSHNTSRLAYHSALWPFEVIQSQCQLKANMQLPWP